MLLVQDQQPAPEGVNAQKSPEVPATLQYVGFLTKDGSRVFMTPKTETKMISPKFFKNGGRWLERAETFLTIVRGTEEHVKDVLNAAWAAEKKRVAMEVKEAEDKRVAKEAKELRMAEEAKAAAELAVLLATPSPHGVIVGTIARQSACVFNLREFRVGLLKEMRDLGEACVEKGKQIKSLHNERMAGLERIAVLFRAGRSHDDFDVVWEERSMIGLMDQLEKLAWDLECLGKRMEDAKAEFGTGI